MSYPQGGQPVEKSPRRLTRKQRKLVRAKVLDPDATMRELGEVSGYTSVQHVARELAKPHVQDEVRSLLNERPKLRLGSLLLKLEEGLDATEIRSLKVSESGGLKADAEVVDHSVRHKYLETALELHGAKKGKDEGAAAGPLNIAIILAGGGSEAERSATVDVLLASRLARGLHPIENRRMTEKEAEQFQRKA